MTDLLTMLEPADTAPAAVDQWYATELQLVKWGTFQKYHRTPISRHGHLFTGENGRGKTTCVDGLFTVIFAPKDIAYNAAADLTEKFRDRSLYTYVRGAHGNEFDADKNVKTQYLRPGASWSALALTLRNDARGEITLIRGFRVGESTGSTDGVSKIAMIVDNKVDIRELEPHMLKRIDKDGLRKAFAPIHISTEFAPYQEKFLDLLGIKPEVMKLLQKLQSKRGVDTLDALMREFVLDEPASFQKAADAVAQFRNLKVVRDTLVTARDQMNHLLPIRGLKKELEDSRQSERELTAQLEGLERVRAEQSALIYARDITSTRHRIEEADAAITRQQEAIAAARSYAAELQAKYLAAGGSGHTAMKLDVEKAGAELEKRTRRRKQFTELAEAAGWEAPGTRDEFDAFMAKVASEKGKLESGRPENLERSRAAHLAVHEVEALHRDAKTERDSLRSRGDSNVRDREDRLRRFVADGIGVSRLELPFVAELVQVKPDQSQWRGAIERVMNATAKSMVVPDRHRDAVARFVNDHHLRGKLVYLQVDDRAHNTTRNVHKDSLIRKVDVKDGEFAEFMTGWLHRFFDYRCVQDFTGLDKDILAVTIRGLERGRNGRHVKDDRTAIESDDNWILGFDNVVKLAQYEREVERLAKAVADATAARDRIDKEDSTRTTTIHFLTRLLEAHWEDIDTADTAELLAIAKAILAEALSDADLTTLSAAADEAERGAEKLRDDLDPLRADLRELTKQLQVFDDGRSEELATAGGEPEVDPYVAATLIERLAITDTTTVLALTKRSNLLTTALNNDRAEQQSRGNDAMLALTKIFGDFRSNWKEAGTDLDQTISSYPDFLRILERIENDDLPRFLERFQQMMQEGAARHLTDLLRGLGEERREIHNRIDPINESLKRTEYNEGTHLWIDAEDINTEDYSRFKKDLSDFTQASALAAPDTAEARYDMLAPIMARLGSEDPKDVKWKRKVLDVRLHVQFNGVEMRGEEVVNVYPSGTGLSGGEKAKLLTFMLATALKYQLTDEYNDIPVFAPVFFDEAFSNSGEKFARQSLEAFRKFGFQTILVAPPIRINLFKEYVRGITVVHRPETKPNSTFEYMIVDADGRLAG